MDRKRTRLVGVQIREFANGRRPKGAVGTLEKEKVGGRSRGGGDAWKEMEWEGSGKGAWHLKEGGLNEAKKGGEVPPEVIFLERAFGVEL